jgi:hypothetical protein
MAFPKDEVGDPRNEAFEGAGNQDFIPVVLCFPNKIAHCAGSSAGLAYSVTCSLPWMASIVAITITSTYELLLLLTFSGGLAKESTRRWPRSQFPGCLIKFPQPSDTGKSSSHRMSRFAAIFYFPIVQIESSRETWYP